MQCDGIRVCACGVYCFYAGWEIQCPPPPDIQACISTTFEMMAGGKDETGASDDDDQGNGDPVGGALRGMLRSVVRRATKATAKLTFGSMPRPQTLAKHAERLSDVLDITKNVSMERLNQLQIEAERLENEKKRKGPLRQFGVSVVYALPSIVKSSVAGGALFSCYDYVHAYLSASARGSVYEVAVPLLSGLAGGALHALVSVSWDNAQQAFPAFAKKRRPSLFGTLASHSLLHGALFSSYHVLKGVLRDAPPPPSQPSQADVLWDAAAVTAAGGLAGMLAEVAGHYLKPLESAGLRAGLRAAARLSRPALRGLLSSAIPSGIGFLAFEYG